MPGRSSGNAGNRIRLIVVDDNDLVRDGLKIMLSEERQFEVVGEASNGRDALALCRSAEPDLALMDVQMPVMNGLTATRKIKSHFPRISVLMLTVHENQDYMLEAIRAGAAGYVLKDDPKSHLTDAMRKVLSGDVTLNRRLADRLIQRMASELRGTPPDLDLAESPLTTRQIEVLELVALGKTNGEIAQVLGRSRGTVKRHLENIIGELGVSDRTQAVVRALELRLLTLPGQS